MKTYMKAMLMFGTLVVAGSAMAAVTDTIILTVTPVGTKSVAITENTYDFGSLNLGTTGNINASSITVTNDGTILESYALRISAADGVWTHSADMTPGSNEYVLTALFNGSTAPGSGAFNGAGGTDDLVTTSQALSTGTNYSNGVETGVGVVPLATRGLWFRLDMPTSSTVATQRSFTVEIEAQ